MGAFVVAAQTGVPLVPLVITGTRSILRAGQWFPRRGAISVAIGAPIMPQGGDWTAAIALRDAARAQMLEYCHAPDLSPDFEASPSIPFPSGRGCGETLAASHTTYPAPPLARGGEQEIPRCTRLRPGASYSPGPCTTLPTPGTPPSSSPPSSTPI